jgi:uncharacterized protein
VAPADSRIAALDVARGVAILGTFASNVWIFATPGGPRAFLAEGFASGPAETVLTTLSNGKFLALLTLLFGVGIEIQYRSAVRRGTPWPGRYPLRAAVLFTEGLLHYLLVFEFDVLMGYAITSLLVAYLVGRSDRVVRAVMAVVGGVYVAAVLALTALLAVLPDAPAGSAPATDTGSWPAQVVGRVTDAGLYRIEIPLIVLSGTVLFLAGSRLVRAGAFGADATGARLRRRLMIVGLGAGIPLTAAVAAAGPGGFLVARYLVPPLVAFGLLALVTEVVMRVRGGVLRRGVAAVGRAALSAYVLQNVLASVLCYDWGLGLAGRLADARPWWVLGLWAGVSGLLLVLAPLWLRRFDRGPLELAMHRVIAPRRPVTAR